VALVRSRTRLDPEEARAIIDPALKLMIDAAHRYDGYVVQSTGDGIFALFGAPAAHEDHPQQALYAALRMQEELRGYGGKLQAEGLAPVEIRVGVNTGEVVVRSITTGAGQVEYTPIGHTTNLASRLQSIARTGSIVASEATRKLCEGYFILKPLGATRVKGVSEPVNVYEVTGLGPLRTRLQRRTRREKVNGRIVTLDAALEDTRPYLFSLLGIVEGNDPLAQMEGQVKKRRTLEAIKRILLRESLNQPLMAIFEDLHWIDEATQDFLNLLTDSLGTAKILLLVNYRPEYSHQWNSKTYYTQLRLDPLGKESAAEMLSALLGDGVEVAALKHLIIENTEGNPFIMEETVQVLFDEGALVRDGAAVKRTKALDALKIPPTVQGILAARIDRLPADAKELLQTLAVIGREFPLLLIGAVVTKSDDELNRLLNDLQLGEFIYEQPAVGDTEYLIERRKEIHERAAQVTE